ncbi:ribosome maturation factor RimM [Bartonella tamiae]|uniref:Ribosome maturation factor RimM n=1 Tax=Bartonella tamiae Th239 TaxID=1094558 RepID=J1K334_9HYPH|nr:ribosome maturation factor RimM [Bartonella tamiae]EJF91515.1 16S rRNA processing protein RimM [Bartonella tamiae Th239]EJF92501.1 16S rRNA processing protein RimM [Bartonella tamiae Th307]
MPKTKDYPVQIARIGAAHGIKGEVRVKSFTNDPMDLTLYEHFFDDKGLIYTIDTVRIQKNILIVRFHNIVSRDEAELLKGKALYVKRHQFLDNLDSDEFYHTDLVGLGVKDLDGTVIGKVNAVFDFGAGDLLELDVNAPKLTLQKTHFIPFTKAAVPEIIMDEGMIIIDPLAAGLINNEEDDDSDKEEKS